MPETDDCTAWHTERIVPSALDAPILGISTSVGIRCVPEWSGDDRTGREPAPFPGADL